MAGKVKTRRRSRGKQSKSRSVKRNVSRRVSRRAGKRSRRGSRRAGKRSRRVSRRGSRRMRGGEGVKEYPLTLQNVADSVAQFLRDIKRSDPPSPSFQNKIKNSLQRKIDEHLNKATEEDKKLFTSINNLLEELRKHNYFSDIHIPEELLTDAPATDTHFVPIGPGYEAVRQGPLYDRGVGRQITP